MASTTSVLLPLIVPTFHVAIRSLRGTDAGDTGVEVRLLSLVVLGRESLALIKALFALTLSTTAAISPAKSLLAVKSSLVS